jgi:hypothetical protein
MSHHFDSPTAIEDGRLNLCDLYAFLGPSNTSTLILTTNPDAGRSSPTTFRPDALYEFVIASEGGTLEDRALRMVFSDAGPDGHQKMHVLYTEGESSRQGLGGLRLGTGANDRIFPLDGGGVAWFGLAADPFWADGVALAGFLAALDAGNYRPDVFGSEPNNIFAGRNVTAIALRLPNSALGGTAVSLWARISLYGHAVQKQVSRFGIPMLRPLFFPVPGPDAENLNGGSPADDIPAYAGRLEQVAARLATLHGSPNPGIHARSVARAFLPDVLTLRPAQPARYQPGTGNGRSLHDDAFGTALSVLNGSPLGVTPSPHPIVPEFPHLLPANTSDLPSLADLFGLRPVAPTHHATSAPTNR